MRVAYLAAGAGGMYCGSCLRDNRLAATLLEQGRDVTLVPLYTPLRTDEASALPTGGSRLFYGGINVFLQQRSAIFRRLPTVLNRILDTPALVERLARRAGSVRPESLGPLTVSVLRGADGAQRRELDKLVAGMEELKPDLINLPNLMFVGVAQRLRDALGIPIVCTLSGEDVFTDRLSEPHRTEVYELIGQQSVHVDAFIAVTHYYARRAAEHFGLRADRITYVPMGVRLEGSSTDADRYAPADRRPSGGGAFTIGYLARICQDKGLHTLAAAFLLLRQQGRDCRLRVAGYLAGADRPYLQRIVTDARAAGFGDEIEIVGEVDRQGKLDFLRSLDVLSVPTAYPEAKGFYVLEALACGVPVVQPPQGSFPELIEQTEGGVLSESAEPQSIAVALASLMDDPKLRQRLGRQGRAAVGESFTAEVMAHRTWELYERIVKAYH